MKGKKFDAHEKHFKEKEIKYKRNINKMIERTNEINIQNMLLTEQNQQLKKENLDVKTKYEKLLEYSKLTDNEIKQTLQFNKSANEFNSILKTLTNFM